MKLTECIQLATTLMAEHDLRDGFELHKKFDGQKHNYWRFAFDNAVIRFGCTHYATKTITLSRKLVELNDEQNVRDVILHEIAHVLAGAGAGHGYKWRSTALSIGCDGRRKYDVRVVNRPAGNYYAPCTCGNKHERVRMPRASYRCAITREPLTFMRVV